ncbi:hypothetical protein [Streptomyces acidicola]|uniref:Uncharacterized protein n=1 Tax=Streptomyces acidicola TaxID=2596892 RepID=A0A5N8WJN5_9ACTN|nr:hypothetical protein [Streptomyces acidicola]MPY47183.1 hypothetical protein [Streptomyces acidicola]MPY47322.1 hypothetical protein [Streptomyces acidicola]
MWLSLVSAITGAVIATASSAFLDHHRWRRDQAQQLTDTRRVLYGEYLAALSKARNHFRSLARDLDIDPKERGASARTSFVPCYDGRYQIAITASAKVVAASEETFRKLRNIRDVAGSGALAGDERYAEGRSEYEVALAKLRKAMREELGADRV